MNNVIVPVWFCSAQPIHVGELSLCPDDLISCKSTSKQIRAVLKRKFPGIDVADALYSCQPDQHVALPKNVTALEYSDKHTRLHVTGPQNFLLQLVSSMSTMQDKLTVLERRFNKLEAQQPRLLVTEMNYQMVQKRNILVRSRDKLGREGKQTQGVKFWRFASTLTAAFLSERGLTLEALELIVNGSIHTCDLLVHSSSTDELLCGLEGLEGDEKRDMKILYDYIT